MNKQQYMEQIKHNPRLLRIFNAVMECTKFREAPDFVKFWDFIIQGFEYEAYHRGMKEAERVIKAGRGQINVK